MCNSQLSLAGISSCIRQSSQYSRWRAPHSCCASPVPSFRPCGLPALRFLRRCATSRSMSGDAANLSQPSPGLEEVAPHDLIKSSPRLLNALTSLITLGASGSAGIYDRQNLGAIGERSLLGPPGRVEFNEVADPQLSVINLAAYGYLGLGNDPRVKAASIAAIERHGTHAGGTRVLCGTTRVHWDFERRLAAFVR